VISSDLLFEGFDSRTWTNLLSLFDPGLDARINREPPSSDAAEGVPSPASNRQGTLVVVVDEARRVLTAVHSGRGAIDGLEIESPRALCKRYAATRCYVLRRGALEDAFEQLAIRMRPTDDYVSQWMTFAAIVRELREAGQFEAWPAPLAKLPIPTSTMMRRTFDLVLPEGHTFLLALWEGTNLWTAAALHREHDAIQTIAGPDAIARWVGPLGGDYMRDYRIVADAVGQSLGPLHLGVFAEAATVRRLLQSYASGEWARAIATREVIVYPTPPSMMVAIGADAAGAALQASSKLIGDLPIWSMIEPLTDFIRGRVSELRSLGSTLGFNPLEALASWMGREEAADTDSEPSNDD